MLKMKRICLYLIITIVIIILPLYAIAANSSVTVTKHLVSRGADQIVIKLACVGDDGNGSVPATQLTNALVLPQTDHTGDTNYQDAGYYLYEVWTDAGSPAPDAADITITDELSFEIYAEVGIIQAGAAPVEGTISKYRAISSLLTVTVANQGTSAAEFDIYLKFVR
jgi:hypothetical protein